MKDNVIISDAAGFEADVLNFSDPLWQTSM